MSRTPYASIEDVRSLLTFVATFTATSRPNATQVQTALEMASNDLDAILSGLDYTLPVPSTATASLDTLRTWAAVGAAHRAALAMPQGADSKHAKDYGGEWQAILKSLEQGKRELPDAPKSSRARGRFGTPGASPAFVGDPTKR